MEKGEGRHRLALGVETACWVSDGCCVRDLSFLVLPISVCPWGPGAAASFLLQDQPWLIA